MAPWDDKQYLQFSNERTRPAVELLARVPLIDADVVVDLGCGPGNSTHLLKTRWPGARVIGVDSSDEMLQRARADFPAGEWVCSDALSYRPNTPPDLVFSNALLHWLPDHTTVFPRLVEQLRSGGVLAVQMPQNFAAPSHRLMRELDGPWRARLEDIGSAFPVHSPEFYYDLLAPRVHRLDIWQTTYAHVMPDVASIVDWVKGTGIRPYLAALSAEEQTQYLAAYARGIDAAYPEQVDGKRLFFFSRLFIIATR